MIKSRIRLINGHSITGWEQKRLFDGSECGAITQIITEQKRWDRDYWFMCLPFPVWKRDDDVDEHSIYTSFDMGIKVGDEWWFEGDILGDDISAEGILWYDEELCFWTVGAVGKFEESNGLWSLMKKVKCERIGTMYDKGEK